MPLLVKFSFIVLESTGMFVINHDPIELIFDIVKHHHRLLPVLCDGYSGC